MSLPSIIFTPGAWHTPEAFQRVIAKLEPLGYKCIAIAMPSVGRDPPVQDGSSDIAAVRDAVLEECDSGKDVVVCAHSWSGFVVGSALEGLGKAERAKHGKKGVTKIAFIAAFVAPKGISVFDAVGGKPPDLWRIEGDQVYANDPINAFYHDLEPSDAQYWASRLKPHAKEPKFSKTTAAAHLDIPSVYLVCEDDRAIPSFVQEGMVKQAQDSGANMEVERIPGGHSPFLTRPDQVVDFLIRAAGTGGGIE